MKVSLHHLADLELYALQRPFELASQDLVDEAESSGEPTTNLRFVAHDVELTDMRDSEEQYDLDTTGFMPLHYKSGCLPGCRLLARGDSDASATVSPYLKETRSFVQSHLKASKVSVVDWLYRENSHGPNTPLYNNDEIQPPKPLQFVHSDFSLRSGWRNVGRHLTPKQIQAYSKPPYRIRIINFWRPLVPIVQDAPLALCDRRTTRREDLRPLDRSFPDEVIETALMVHRLEHRWFWLSEQTQDEALLFVVWDSSDCDWTSEDIRGLVVHGSFQNPVADIDAPPRRSIEVQLIVVTSDAPM